MLLLLLLLLSAGRTKRVLVGVMGFRTIWWLLSLPSYGSRCPRCSKQSKEKMQ
jgi:hypothetical protein